MQMFARHGNRWNVNELLSLQREYELLEWSVDQIALKHKRTVNSILFKLENEGLISNWNEARGFVHSADADASATWKVSHDECSEDDEEEEMDDCNDEDYVEEESCSEMNDDCSDEDESSQVAKLADRVWSLESSVNDISIMVKQIFDSMISKKRPLSSCH